MREKELLHEIDRVVRDSDSLSGALGRVQSLLASEWGEALLFVRPSGHASFPPAVSQLLDSRDFPFRGLYVAPVQDGTLLACIGTWETPGELFRRVTSFVGQHLASLARRLSLAAPICAEAA